MAPMNPRALVRCVVEQIGNRGDLALADALFTADYVNHAGRIPDCTQGPEAIKISVAFSRTAFPDLRISRDQLTAKKDAVLLRWTARSRPGSGSLNGILVRRFAGGKIAESWTQWDQAGVMERFGLRNMRELRGVYTQPRYCSERTAAAHRYNLA